MAASRVRIPWVALFGYVPSFGVGMFGILATVAHVTIYCRPQSRRPRWLGRLSSCLLKSISRVQLSPSAIYKYGLFLA